MARRSKPWLNVVRGALRYEPSKTPEEGRVNHSVPNSFTGVPFRTIDRSIGVGNWVG